MKDYNEKLQKYHFAGYKNLIATLLGLNVAGITGAIAYMGIVLNKASRCEDTIRMLPSLKGVFVFFLLGLIFVFVEIFLEYISYFFRYNKSTGNDKNQCEYKRPQLSCFDKIQISLITASIICLFIGGVLGANTILTLSL